MIKTDEDALVCDLAETYHIYRYRELPVSLLATLSVGLRADSRIMMKLNRDKVPADIMLMASLLDTVNMLRWELGGGKGNKPKFVLDSLNEDKNSLVRSFNSPNEFEQERKKILERSRAHG